MKNEGATKICKHCKTEISKGAKVCPQCRKKQSSTLGGIVILVVIVGVIGAALDGTKGSEATPATPASSSTTTKSAKATKKEKATKEKAITYAAFDVGTLMDDLRGNAMSAKEKYNKQYVKITGKLNNIDSDGKYISLTPSDEEFAIIGVQCYLRDDDQKTRVASMSIGDTVTLNGKVKDVGEVLGYSLDIDSIN